MTSNVIHLNGGDAVVQDINPPVETVVELLEKMLVHAKSGRLRYIFAVGVNSDRSVASCWDGEPQYCFQVLGGVEECKIEFTLKEFQRRD